MRLDIRNHEYSIIWEGTYYHALSNYPNISNWELKTIIQFIEYEKSHKREVEITSDNEKIIKKINYALINKDYFFNIPKPDKITECTACIHKGCLTKYLCHTAPIKNAISIIKNGSILSAVKARNISAEQLKFESRNAAKDPSDYFEYLMLSYGNCQAGDRLVMERKLKRNPNDNDLGKGFTPGIRFYFKYDELIKHPNATFDGYHPLKIKDELNLKDYIYAIIIPKAYEEMFFDKIPENIKNKVYYLENNCNDIWEWSKKVYDFIIM